MKKAPSYKGGGNLIKGEPNKPKKTTIDRTKYKEILDRPIEGSGTNVVGDSQDNFTPEVLKNMGYNYYSGTMGGKDIVYEKGGRYHIYNEQPNAKQNKFGLIDIGDLSEPTVNPAPIMAPNVVAPLAKPTINPNHQALNLSNPNMVLDPNTGTYTNPVTGKRIEPIVEQYKHGGKVKGYAFGTTEDGVVPQYNLTTQSQGPMIQTTGSAPSTTPITSSYQSAITSAQQKNVNKQNKQSFLSKNQNTSKALGAGVLTLGNQMYQREYGPGANQEQEAKYDNAVTGVDTAASSLTPWYALAKGASNIGKSQIKRDENGRATTKVGSVSDDWLTPDHELIMQGYKQDGVKGGIREITGLGKIGRTIGTLTNNANETEGFWGKFNKATGQAGKNKAAGMDEAAKQAQLDAAAIEEARQKDAMDKARISEALSTRNAGFADGGEIKGKGGPKSDSINAKVEEGSFIVPAENADIAKQLAIKILGKNPSKKANLSQGGETPVKLSDGEYMFSPEEKMELEANGIDLSTLAPNAKEDLINHLKCGGKVKGYAAGGNVDPKKELARINALSAKEAADRNALAKAKSDLSKSNKQKLSRAEDVRRAKAEHDRLSSGIDMLNKEYEKLDQAEKNKSKRLIGQSEERIRAEKIKVLNQIDKLQQDRDAVKATYDAAPIAKKSTTVATNSAAGGLDYLRGDKTTTQETVTPPLTTNTITESVTTKKAPSAKSKGVSTKEVMTADVLPATSVNQIPTDSEPGLYGERTAEEKLRMAQANQDAQVSSPSSTGNATSTAGGGTPSPTSGERKGINWDGIGSNAVNYELPILQTAIGLKKLKELGKRPVDSLDPQYLQTITKTSGDVQTARENAKFGYTGDEMSAINQENAALTNTGRAFARNVAGGSSAVGLNAERSVLNDAFGRKLQSKISDNALKMQKQEQAMARQQDLNSMLAHKQELNRRLFNDTLGAWSTDQSSAGQLVNAGLSNAIDAKKYSDFKKQYEQAQTK